MNQIKKKLNLSGQKKGRQKNNSKQYKGMERMSWKFTSRDFQKKIIKKNKPKSLEIKILKKEKDTYQRLKNPFWPSPRFFCKIKLEK